MLKENVLVLVEKKKKGGTRTHLLSLANNPTPFVVCSNYVEDNTTVGWDWGHYHSNIISALFTLFEYDIKNIFSLEDIDIQAYINYFEYSNNYVPEDRPKLSTDQRNILPEILSVINVELEKNCKSNLRLG